MPRGDGTGPMGEGPKTGWGQGLCAGYPVQGYTHPTFGFRHRWSNVGRGWRFHASARPCWLGAPYATFPGPLGAYQGSKDELTVLRQEADHLTNVLEDVHKRISQLEGNKNK